MKYVARKMDAPPSLRKNGLKWRDELLQNIRECKNLRKKVPEVFFNKYKQDDVRKALAEMYSKLCCYCESKVGIVDFPHIEHLKPKSIFPEHTFDWDNLHLACTQCNTAKGNKWDKKYPILDPSRDEIPEHLEYELEWVKPITKRGEITEAHTKLNRSELLEARREIVLITMRVISQINKARRSPNAAVTRKQLEGECKGAYGSLIQYAIERFAK